LRNNAAARKLCAPSVCSAGGAWDGCRRLSRQRWHRRFLVPEGVFMKIVNALKLSAAAALLVLGASASAQSSSYTPGTVWTLSNIKVEPGQFEAYLDFLDKTWKKGNDYGVQQGYVVSYHVFAVNNSRSGEPDLILAIESKDYLTTAQQLEMQKKFEAFMAMDAHKLDAASGERKVLRKLDGSMELQELKLK